MTTVCITVQHSWPVELLIAYFHETDDCIWLQICKRALNLINLVST